MIMPAMLLTSLGLVVQVADAVPRYDIRRTCRAAVTLAAGSEGRTVDSCMAGEEAARKDLEKQWAKVPAARADPVRWYRGGWRLAELCRASHLPGNDARLAHSISKMSGPKARNPAGLLHHKKA